MIEPIILNYDDISISAAAFELFWREYRRANREWYNQAEVHEKRYDHPALIEYRLYAMGVDYRKKSPTQTSMSYATIRFQKLPSNRQRISLHMHSLHDDYNFYQCVLSEASARKDAERMFASYSTYLGEQVPTLADSDTGKKREMNIETPVKVAKARLIMERKGKTQTVACNLTGVAPKTFRKWHEHPDVLCETNRLEQDKEFQEYLEGI